MNANGNASYAQLRAGARARSYSPELGQDAEYQGPRSTMSLQRGNLQSTSFVFKSADLSPDKPQSYSADTRTSILGAGTSSFTPNPSRPTGD